MIVYSSATRLTDDGFLKSLIYSVVVVPFCLREFLNAGNRSSNFLFIHFSVKRSFIIKLLPKMFPLEGFCCIGCHESITISNV